MHMITSPTPTTVQTTGQNATNPNTPPTPVGCIICRDPVGIHCCEYGRDK